MPFLDAIPVFGPWRIKRDAKKYDKWCAFIQTRSFGTEIFQIVGIRQQAQTGLKAYGRWLHSGQTCAAETDGRRQDASGPAAAVAVARSGDPSSGAFGSQSTPTPQPSAEVAYGQARREATAVAALISTAEGQEVA